MTYGTLWLVLLGCPWISVEEHQANMFPTGWVDTADTWDTTTTEPNTTNSTTVTTAPTTTTDTTTSTTTGTIIPSPCDGPAVRLNEVMSRNDAWASPDGSFVSWVELVEANGEAANLAGHTVVSYETDATRFWSFAPDVVLPEDGHLVVWGEGDLSTPYRAPFAFSAARGGELALFDPDGCELDRVSFPPMWTPYSFGRSPSRSGDWMLLASATPEGSNIAEAPDFDDCSPDAYQYGSDSSKGFLMDLPGGVLYGTACEGETPYPGMAVLADFYTAILGPNDILTIRMLDGLGTQCIDSDLALIPLTGADGGGVSWSGPGKSCPEISIAASGWGNDGLAVLAPGNIGNQDYFLEWEVNTCVDTDGDGQLDASCGGNDCAPFDPSVYLGAPESFVDTMGVVDRNCDGFVESESCHVHDRSDIWFDPTYGSVPSLSPSSWKTAYDIYTLDVNAGDCVVVQTDIPQTFGPMLSLWGKEGGFDRISAFSADMLPCSRSTWFSYSDACPRGNFVATQTGQVQFAVGQQTSYGLTAETPTSGMPPADGQYMIEVFVNGTPAAINLLESARIAGSFVSPLD